MYPEIIEFSPGRPVQAHLRCIVEYPYHWHDALEIIIALEGQAEVTLCGETHLLKEQDIAVVNINEPHRIEGGTDNNCLLSVLIDPDFCRSVHPDFDQIIFHCCSTYHEQQAPEKYRQLKGCLARLVSGLRQQDTSPLFYEINVVNYLTELLARLTGGFDYLRYGAGVKPFKEKQVQRNRYVFERLRAEPGLRHGVSELARENDISLQHFSYDIKEKFGLTFRELVACGRCMTAVRLLLGTGKMVGEIAAECGFSHRKYLIKAFKQFYGCTPFEFRKRHQANAEMLAVRTRYQEIPFFPKKLA
ncbi:MAG: AraC family transcriptional regulator [Clostridia bacterium]|jgi:AraC-like DNA-binding protein|nr:AraC family transcriptional regulator [Clostridia bacterium]